MRNLLLAVIVVALCASGANAHDGMLALFSDESHTDCDMDLATFQTGSMYLMYERGEGPYMGQACEFKLLKSSPGVLFLEPTWAPNVITEIIIGTIETGIAMTSVECFPAEDYVYIGTIPVMNFADPDTFSVKVVRNPEQVDGVIAITLCDSYHTLYAVSGSGFLFNMTCYEPLDPFGTVGVEPTTWGAVKNLYR